MTHEFFPETELVEADIEAARRGEVAEWRVDRNGVRWFKRRRPDGNRDPLPVIHTDLPTDDLITSADEGPSDDA